MFRSFTLSALLCFGVAGCATDAPSLSVRSEQTNDHYTATFDRAIFSQNQDGQIDLILLAGGKTNDDGTGLPITASNDQSVRQVVHLRVLYEARNTIRVDSPSAGNAVLTWNVLAGADNRLSYNGSCWAKVKIDGNEADVDIRNAVVSIRRSVGQMNDPLKRASLEGEFVATRADLAVKTYLTELATLEQASQTAAVSNR